MNTIEVMKQALAALDNYPNGMADAITNLRAAIEQYEAAEPCGWLETREGKVRWNPNVGVSLNAALFTHPAHAVPEGWQLVPKEATLEMWAAASDEYTETESAEDDCNRMWRAMLKAAPKP